MPEMPGNRRPIEEIWNGFAALVIAPGASASAAQRADMKASFYAGAHGLFSILMDAVSESGEPTESGFDTMGDIEADLGEFFRRARRAQRAPKAQSN